MSYYVVRGSPLADPTCGAMARYAARYVAHYTAGGHTDECGVYHASGLHYAWPLLSVLNEDEYATPPEGGVAYTACWDAWRREIAKVNPQLQLVGPEIATNERAAPGSGAWNYTTHFLKAFGVTSFTMTATARAAKAGGAGTPLNIMFVLDSTQSMNTGDTGCTVPGVTSPTRFQCAQYSVQSILKVLQPTMANVGLMIFPGTGTKYTPGSPCPTQPSSVPYLSSTIYYQIGSFTSSFNNGSGTLTDTSAIVQAVGDRGTSLAACISAKGGEGTYLAEVITKAQAAFPVVAGYKNVIILLSDGDSGASQAQLNNQSSKVSKQCGQYVTAAQTATAAGTTVYAVAYGAPTSGCSSGDTYNPCTAMQAAASDTSKFFSTNNTCAAPITANTVANLPTIFTQLAVNLTKPRLL